MVIYNKMGFFLVCNRRRGKQRRRKNDWQMRPRNQRNCGRRWRCIWRSTKPGYKDYSLPSLLEAFDCLTFYIHFPVSLYLINPNRYTKPLSCCLPAPTPCVDTHYEPLTAQEPNVTFFGSLNFNKQFLLFTRNSLSQLVELPIYPNPYPKRSS